MGQLDAWGIADGYHDINGTWHETPDSTARALLRAMGAEGSSPPAIPGLWVVRQGDDVHLGGRWELHTEDGGEERVSGTLPDPPLGYHWLYNADDGRGVRLIVSPGECHRPADLRIWGWAVQLYAARSRRSWGIGDLGDLATLAEWSGSQGARLLLLNPLHAEVPVAPLNPSPYYPSSRCFRSPLYLRVEDVPGAMVLGEELTKLAKQGSFLNDERRIDRDTVLRIKMQALRRIWTDFRTDADFERYVEEQGELLRQYATHCALAERFGASWRNWPAGYRHPESPEVADFLDEPGNADAVRFHSWLQWLVDRQLAAAGGSDVGLMQDLAIGVDPGGADAWMWQDVITPDVSVGAPPDEYNTQGQDWGLPPFNPHRLRAAHFEPFIRTVRAGFRHAGGLRFDHVMGLFRLFWIPAGAGAANGTYVRYPSHELLDILALESHRAGAYVVGEDLGTVEPGVREELASRKVLSYRLLWFEPSPPREYPENALGAVTTHDLPTIAGLWTGRDLEDQERRGMEPNVESTEQLRVRLRDWTGVDDEADVTTVVQRTHGLLAEAPSAIVTATLDDAIGVAERPNYPGTTGGTNWSLALPAPLEDLMADPRPKEIAATLADGRVMPGGGRPASR